MNSIHWHLLLNHIPIIGTMVATAFLVAGFAFKSKPIKMAALGAVFVLSICAIVANKTGENAEESIENVAGINEQMLDEHEDAAGPALVTHVVAGLLSAIALFLLYKEKKGAEIAFIIALLVTLTAVGLMARVGYLGGQIRHTEISSAAGPNGEAGTATPAEGKSDGDDD
jgi:uncharacterized membrane protein